MRRGDAPAVDGIAFVKRMRAMPKLATTPIIFVTAKTGPMDVVAGINAGRGFYMTKPFNPQELPREGEERHREVGRRVFAPPLRRGASAT